MNTKNAVPGKIYPHTWYRRRSTIQVHPNFSEDPHFRSSIPLPKTHYSKSKLHADKYSHDPSTQKCHLSVETRLAFRRFWVKEPRPSEKKRKCATSIVERVIDPGASSVDCAYSTSLRDGHRISLIFEEPKTGQEALLFSQAKTYE